MSIVNTELSREKKKIYIYIYIKFYTIETKFRLRTECLVEKFVVLLEGSF